MRSGGPRWKYPPGHPRPEPCGGGLRGLPPRTGGYCPPRPRRYGHAVPSALRSASTLRWRVAIALRSLSEGGVAPLRTSPRARACEPEQQLDCFLDQ